MVGLLSSDESTNHEMSRMHARAAQGSLCGISRFCNLGDRRDNSHVTSIQGGGQALLFRSSEIFSLNKILCFSSLFVHYIVNVVATETIKQSTAAYISW